MLWKRVLSAAIPLPLVLALVHFGPTWGFGLFIGLCTGVAFHEYLVITGAEPSRVARLVLLAAALGAFWAFHALDSAGALLTLAASFLFAFLWVLVRPGEVDGAFRRAALVFAGFAYTSLLISFLVRLHSLPQGREWIYVSFLVAWGGDTFAYFAGRAFGKRKLYPAISPGKTVEGGIGGLVGSLTGVLAAKYLFFPELTLADCFLAAIPGGVIGQAGDLCESLLKRSHAVKDSGTIMPGHGGLLDRIDALMFLLPYIFAYAVWVHPLVL